MKKLSDKQVLLLAGVGLYLVAYKAGRKDAYKSITKQVKKIEVASQNIGYLEAIQDMVKISENIHKK